MDCAPPICTTEMPSASRFRPRRSASALSAHWSLIPSTRTTARDSTPAANACDAATSGAPLPIAAASASVRRNRCFSATSRIFTAHGQRARGHSSNESVTVARRAGSFRRVSASYPRDRVAVIRHRRPADSARRDGLARRAGSRVHHLVGRCDREPVHGARRRQRIVDHPSWGRDGEPAHPPLRSCSARRSLADGRLLRNTADRRESQVCDGRDRAYGLCLDRRSRGSRGRAGHVVVAIHAASPLDVCADHRPVTASSAPPHGPPHAGSAP